MEWLGDLERAFATSIYPHRVLIASALAIASATMILLAWRGRWDRIVVRHPRGAAAGLLLGLATIGPGAWYLGSPLFLSSSIDEAAPVSIVGPSPAPSIVAEQPPIVSPQPRGAASIAVDDPSPSLPAAERTGSFAGADDFHFARGRARLVETALGEFTVRLEDFAVRNGPDLYVYLSASAAGHVKHAALLGRLKADRGDQNYRVPAGVDVDAARSVVIWCKQFGVLFATATLP
jgi:electron transfer DM13